MTSGVEDLASIQSAKVVDARSSACPGPLLEAKKGIGGVNVGEVLEIWSGSQDTRNNLSRWCKKTGNEFLGFVDEGAYDRLFILRQK
ncbi:MAG: sulfurtransferase TusA family protein [Chloroflexota bacterium]|nr:sulfurtransferase TusA family protein [Chloroflexota bacterium]